ncbi:fumarylacetoacetate hydrolase [Pseudomonas daroniae]|uniref:Fumarylacetoacetate hydrolase n=1 Tax=Phytopseudomonas daroniae TaxID=2487519 RepID=A0A4Q9QQD3_9GAMM|nr:MULTISPECIES: fumarylacetoacetate hydrolase family protein [Pseudomonas]TBU78441.1 fumarylacetoacetate hydrolase [Pseudomonas daroniae]TBU82883.1 fumarylacetoacetate hydrolase [Pseudomonas daroniae]TBU85917.1 fumarylacetoacetate hydrolase [Pseudomonas sp. FRB 228]TBU95080.1 fumarylacetoacetate hydrolase [Pseudomonas daroniae]
MARPVILTPDNTLPEDGLTGTLIGRIWLPGAIAGPVPVLLHEHGVFDLSALSPTLAGLCERENLHAHVHDSRMPRVCSVAELLANSGSERDETRPSLLAPADLQVIKAAGVTFASSMVERVIEERAGGDPQRAEEIRGQVREMIGDNLRSLVPGSENAARLKVLLQEKGLWSQYLEVGIGPDAEVFTKAPVLAAMGSGMDIGIHPKSAWNNPEPEVVLVVNSRGRVIGATLGNDVNLRDFEGRSALLLSKAKDNNGSCAIGPFIRLFDASFGIDDVRNCEVDLRVEGEDGFVLNGRSSMSQISRDPLDLVGQTLNANHQYPDGFLLYLGTLFAPTEDRDQPGSGFTHKLGDHVSISCRQLGGLHNRVQYSDQLAAWQFGLLALIRNLAERRLL